LQEIAKGLVNWRRVVARTNEEMARMVWKRSDTGGWVKETTGFKDGHRKGAIPRGEVML
jgi:hypothetical protein